MVEQDLGPLFAQSGDRGNPPSDPSAGPAVRLRKGVNTFWEQETARAARTVYAELDAIPWPSPAMFASVASATDNAEKILRLAERVANCILDATGQMAVWQVRVQLLRLGLIDGTEKLDCLGSLGTRMGLVAIGVERPPVLAELDVSHRNRNTTWSRREGARRPAA